MLNKYLNYHANRLMASPAGQDLIKTGLKDFPETQKAIQTNVDIHNHIQGKHESGKQDKSCPICAKQTGSK